MNFRQCIAGAAAMALSVAMPAVFADPDAVPAGAAAKPATDHHLHIQGPLISEHLRRIQAAIPEAFTHISDDIFQPRTGQDALDELDRAGIRHGVLLSMAYMFGFALVPLEPEDAAAYTRAENRYNVDAALASNGRLLAFVSVNPFTPWALEELAFWSEEPGASGVKLHLANSGFDPGSSAQVELLAAFFTAAREAGLPLVVHLGAAPLPRPALDTFIDSVLRHAGDLPVQMAHGFSAGGIGPGALDALDALAEAIARDAPGTANLVVDLSTVMHIGQVPPGNDGEAPDLSPLREDYVAKMRDIGMDRFVLGSDWPALGGLADYFEAERSLLPVTDAEWAILCRNQAPYLQPSESHTAP